MTEILTPDVIRFNYYPGSSDGQYSEQYQERILGHNGVIEIKEHSAQGDGDKWYWDVHYDNNRVERIFYPHQVFYSKSVEQEQEFQRIDTTTKAIV